MESLLELLILRLLIVVQVYVFRKKKGRIIQWVYFRWQIKVNKPRPPVRCSPFYVICYKPVNLILQARSLFDISCTRI